MDSNQLRVVGEYFVLQMHMYVKNERLYGSIVCDNIVVQLTNGSKVEKKKEILKFIASWHLLRQGHPTINFESFKSFS
jgi:hypothetical protein